MSFGLSKAEETILRAVEELNFPSVRETISFFKLYRKLLPAGSRMDEYKHFRYHLEKLWEKGLVNKYSSIQGGYGVRYSTEILNKRFKHVCTIITKERYLEWKTGAGDDIPLKVIKSGYKRYVISSDDNFIGIIRRGRFELPGVHKGKISDYENLVRLLGRKDLIIKILARATL